jgi:2-keto-4-pentenoate hydratase/2-oxohepta-3-ene-1,7-dioic acid hydratase in catechol pathway
MKLATVPWKDSSSAAVVFGERVAAVRQLSGRDQASDVLSLIHKPLSQDELRQLSDLTSPAPSAWLPPIIRPPKNLLCVGKNYMEHVKEFDKAWGLSRTEVPPSPMWFSKAHTALIGAGGEIIHDPDFTQALDYEGELVAVIGDRCRKVTAEAALDHVFGYTILNDVTARNVQHGRKQWFTGKSADTYAPCGPWVVTRDEVADPQQLNLRTTVNGEERQSVNTRDMIFGIRALIADISTGMTLEPGDLIATGTPVGVAWGMDPPRYLVPGDEVVVEIEKIGRLWNRVIAAS